MLIVSAGLQARPPLGHTRIAHAATLFPGSKCPAAAARGLDISRQIGVNGTEEPVLLADTK